MMEYLYTVRQRAAMVKRYNNYESLRELARRYSVCQQVIRRVLTEEGVTMRGRGRPSIEQTSARRAKRPTRKVARG